MPIHTNFILVMTIFSSDNHGIVREEFMSHIQTSTVLPKEWF